MATDPRTKVYDAFVTIVAMRLEIEPTIDSVTLDHLLSAWVSVDRIRESIINDAKIKVRE